MTLTRWLCYAMMLGWATPALAQDANPCTTTPQSVYVDATQAKVYLTHEMLTATLPTGGAGVDSVEVGAFVAPDTVTPRATFIVPRSMWLALPQYAGCWTITQNLTAVGFPQAQFVVGVRTRNSAGISPWVLGNTVFPGAPPAAPTAVRIAP